jgi:hypothetical protein
MVWIKKEWKGSQTKMQRYIIKIPGSCCKEVLKGKFVPVEASPKTPPTARQDRKRKGEKNIEFPIKPNRKTRITNLLRLNSKVLFNSSLKDPQPNFDRG